MDEWTIGELVCDGTYLNPVGSARNWYTQGEESVTIQVQHFVAANLELLKPSDQVRLPSACNGEQAFRKGATQLSDDSHMTILDEIDGWDILDYKEEESLSDGDSVSGSGEEPSDESSDGKGGVDKE
jgi:hypothetical protein